MGAFRNFIENDLSDTSIWGQTPWGQTPASDLSKSPIGTPAEPYLLKRLETGVHQLFKQSKKVDIMMDQLRRRVRSIELHFYKLQGKPSDPYNDPAHVLS